MSKFLVRPLGEVATVMRGSARSNETDSADGVPFFGIGEISAGTGPPKLVMPQSGLVDTALQRGDVVVALIGDIGRSTLVPPRYEGAVLSRECALIRPRSGVEGAWIYVWTQSAEFRVQVHRRTSGATIPRLSYRLLSEFMIPIPPAERQREAESLLGLFDDSLSKLRKVQTHLTELRSLEMELLFAEAQDVE